MGSEFDAIDDTLAAWIRAQPMFFVATAPSGSDGHVNVSPKGDMRTFALLGPLRVAYLDLFGSGIETVAHVKQNGRITVMFCAFSGKPRVLRLHGQGSVVEPQDGDFARYLPHFDATEEVRLAMRAIVLVDVERISESCGYGVPHMEVVRDRTALYRTAESWITRHGPSAITDYCAVNGAESIDGLPGLTPPAAEVTDEQQRRHSSAGRRL